MQDNIVRYFESSPYVQEDAHNDVECARKDAHKRLEKRKYPYTCFPMLGHGR